MVRKRKKRKISVFQIISICILFYLSLAFFNQHKIISQLKSEKQQKEKAKKELKAELNEIQNKIENVDSLKYIEKIAREELKMVKPNEIIYIDKSKEDKKNK